MRSEVVRPRGAGLRGVAVLATSVIVGMATISQAAAAPSTFDTGFVDPAVLGSADRDTWLGRAKSVGATRVRVATSWAEVSPTAPSAGEAALPGWSGYRFDGLDAQIRSVAKSGSVPMLSPSGAPEWAAASDRPRGAAAGAWKPDPAAFGRFMQALAARYSGTFPDPQSPGATLPKVDQFQIWNEPNLALYLAPQYEDGQPFAARRFRELVNAGYAGVKQSQQRATVVAAGLAPYGDPGTKTTRTRPLQFLRDMLCLTDGLRRGCTDATTVDVLAIHPYTVNRPSRGAFDKDDVTVPDLGRMRDVITSARRAGTIGPKQPPIWVTELHWETAPDPEGVSFDTRARYISEAFWRLWRAGVPVTFWYLMRDDEYTRGEKYFESYQSGIFYRNGRRKADARAFRFPLLVTGKNSKRMNVWLRTPRTGSVSVQIRRAGRWTTVNRGRLSANRVATVKVPRARVTAVRAISGPATSAVWRVR